MELGLSCTLRWNSSPRTHAPRGRHAGARRPASMPARQCSTPSSSGGAGRLTSCRRSPRRSYLACTDIDSWKIQRDVTVYLPPSYGENAAKPYTDILVLHDGQKLKDEAWALTLDALVLAGTIDEVVVAGVSTPPDGDQRMAELTPSPGDGRRMPEHLAAHAAAAAAADVQQEGEEPDKHGGHDPALLESYAHWNGHHSFSGTCRCISRLRSGVAPQHEILSSIGTSRTYGPTGVFMISCLHCQRS